MLPGRSRTCCPVSLTHSHLHTGWPFAASSPVTQQLWLFHCLPSGTPIFGERASCAPASCQSWHGWQEKMRLGSLAYFTSLSLPISRNCFHFVTSKRVKIHSRISRWKTMLNSNEEAVPAPQLENGCTSVRAIP